MATLELPMSGRRSSGVAMFQNHATANGNGDTLITEGYNGAIQVLIANASTGTCTVTIEGSFFNLATWHAVGYYRVDGQATLTRAASGFAVGAANSGTDKVVLQVLDPYPYMRARISGTAGTIDLSASCYAMMT